MSFKRGRKLILLALVGGVMAGLGGCSSDGEPDRRQTDRVIRMLDDERYTDAIHLMEVETPPAERDQYQPYLAQAYLGRSGFAPLAFASRILAAQSDSAEPELETLIPNCDAGALTSLAKVPVRCVLRRVFSQVPDESDPDFTRAREILREKFPEPRDAPQGYNALSGMVEAASLLSSLKKSVLKYQRLDPATASDAEVFAIFDQVATTAEYARQLLKRARVTQYLGISEKLSGIEESWLFNGKTVNIDYVTETGIPILIALARKPLAAGPGSDAALTKAAIVQALDRIVALLAK